MLENLIDLISSTASTSFNTFNLKDITTDDQPKKTFKIKDYFTETGATEELIGMLENAV